MEETEAREDLQNQYVTAELAGTELELRQAEVSLVLNLLSQIRAIHLLNKY